MALVTRETDSCSTQTPESVDQHVVSIMLLYLCDFRCIGRIKVTTALWVSPSQVFRQTVQLCRLCRPAPDPGAQRAAQEPGQLLEHLVHPEPAQVRRRQEVQHLLGAGQRSVQPARVTL